MHGEYKTPGGKMVVVDFSVTEGALCGVQVSGDFFLYPDHALHQITEALEGLPISVDADAIADQIRRVVAPDVVMLGFSPLAIGRAVCSALGRP
jgi:lipoate---protein ligase